MCGGMMEKGSRGRMQPGAAWWEPMRHCGRVAAGRARQDRHQAGSISALISQGDGRSSRGRLWFGVERGADDAWGASSSNALSGVC